MSFDAVRSNTLAGRLGCSPSYTDQGRQCEAGPTAIPSPAAPTPHSSAARARSSSVVPWPGALSFGTLGLLLMRASADECLCALRYAGADTERKSGDRAQRWDESICIVLTFLPDPETSIAGGVAFNCNCVRVQFDFVPGL
ncbi:hypothetical protein AXG93_3340s1010 [Marchantia polymorpha subsp. ruderalis]|uniref:Uncharacterized protein n=1 Tax=Marchantia polymorpha subsp. ruderalis TaxID=1480154 RepID=A0A176VUF4_MARPO|nr:hypothetical protein AXG93_3340s1010 [Marchantia polymorpha subsp. ruderalis]